MTPAVSVLLPVRDAEPTIASALRSLLSQSFSDWECVVVDDGSTDGTARVVSSFVHRDPRLRLLQIEPRGLVEALNLGLRHCRGRFVARMDGDDLMHRQRLALQQQLLERSPELAAVGTHVRIFPRPGLTDGRREYERWLNSLRSCEDVMRDRFVECPIAHPTLFVRREVLLDYGYRDLGWAEDYDLVLRLLAAGERLALVDKPLLFWRDHRGRLSRTSVTYQQSQFVACKAHFLAASWLNEERDYVLWGYGDTGRNLCRALARLGKTLTHLVELHPGRLGQRIAGAAVIAPDTLSGLVPRPRRIVVSVAGQTARQQIRDKLTELGFAEGVDYVCAA